MKVDVEQSSGNELQSERGIVLRNALDEMNACIDRLVDLIQKERDYPIWIWQVGDPGRAREALVAMLRAIEYLPEQEARVSRILPGVVGASPYALEAAEALNKAKRGLKEALKPLYKKVVTVKNPETGEKERRSLAKVMLSRMGLPHYHDAQAGRELVVLREFPESISFFWRVNPHMERLTAAEARKRVASKLKETGTTSPSALLREIEAVSALPPETPLVCVRPGGNPEPRANLLLPDTGEGVRRPVKRLVLPLFIPAIEGGALPTIQELPDNPDDVGRKRKKRRDAALEEEPFLQSISVHRYLPGREPKEDSGQKKKK